MFVFLWFVCVVVCACFVVGLSHASFVAVCVCLSSFVVVVACVCRWWVNSHRSPLLLSVVVVLHWCGIVFVILHCVSCFVVVCHMLPFLYGPSLVCHYSCVSCCHVLSCFVMLCHMLPFVCLPCLSLVCHPSLLSFLLFAMCVVFYRCVCDVGRWILSFCIV